jgi:hypothetical protein
MSSSTYRPAGRVFELEGLGTRVVVIGAGQAGLAGRSRLTESFWTLSGRRVVEQVMFRRRW